MARSERERTRDFLADIARIVRREERLDDLEWAISRDLPKVRRIIGRYRASLLKTTDDFVFSPTFEQVVNEALEDFEKRMAAHIPTKTIKERKRQRNRIIRSIRVQYRGFLRTQMDTLAKNQNAKITTFQALADLAKIPAGIEDEVLRRVNTVRIKGVDMNTDQLTNVWQQLQNRYGNHNQVIFTSGQKRSLEAYVDGRTVTTKNEIHRATTVITASANGVVFGRINRTGTQDSCILHEGRLVFFSQAAKDIFQAENPGIKVSHIPTVQDLEQDPTHLFSFGCKHHVIPTSVQFSSEGEQVELFDAQTPTEIPQDLRTATGRPSESKIHKEILAGRFAA